MSPLYYESSSLKTKAVYASVPIRIYFIRTRFRDPALPHDYERIMMNLSRRLSSKSKSAKTVR